MNTNMPVNGERSPCESAPAMQFGSHPYANAASPYGGAVLPPPSVVAGTQRLPYTVCPRQPFSASKADLLVLVLTFVLGFLFMRLLAFTGMQGFGVSIFCFIFGAAVLTYAAVKEVKPKWASWFWLAIMELCGLSYALWAPGLWVVWQDLLCCGAAVYWCGCLFGMPLAGKTSNFLPLDVISQLFVVPFNNLENLVPSLGTLKKKDEGSKGSLQRLLPLALGIIICIPMLAMVLPLLVSADQNNFGRLLREISRFFTEYWLWRFLQDEIGVIVLQLILGVPVGLWLFGLLTGGAHKRYTRTFDLKKATQTLENMRIAPAVTVLLPLGVASAVYLLFIGCQIPYFFSAFAGIKPEQYAVYSEYAREGFFELCRIAAINLGLLALSGCFVKRMNPDEKVKGLRFLNILLSVLTLLVIATAFSKMGLYIANHGFTPRRIMTCVFMLFLAGLCVGVVVFQYKRFSLVRFAAGYGAALLCAMCLCNLNGIVVHYNAARYASGTLEMFDELIVARSGPAGAPAAMKVYEAMDKKSDPARTQRLEWALYKIYLQAEATKGTTRDCLSNIQARSIIKLPVMQITEKDLTDEERACWQANDGQGYYAWRDQYMAPARRTFERHYASQLDRSGYEQFIFAE